MGDDAFDKVDARRSEARDHDVDTDLIAYMTFLEIVRTAGRITEIRTQFGYRSRTRWKSVEGLNILRNAVMHPTKSLITPTRPLARLAERDRLLRSLLSQASELAPLTVGASRAEPLSP